MVRRFLVQDVQLLITTALLAFVVGLSAFGWQTLATIQRSRDQGMEILRQSRILESLAISLADADRLRLDHLRRGADVERSAYHSEALQVGALVAQLRVCATPDHESCSAMSGLAQTVAAHMTRLEREVEARPLPAAKLAYSPAAGASASDAGIAGRLTASNQLLRRRLQKLHDGIAARLGTLRWVAGCVAAGGVLALISVFHLRNRAWRSLVHDESQQRAAAMQLRGCLDGLSQGVAVFSDDAALLNWNQRLSQILDLPDTLLEAGLRYDALERRLAPSGAPFLEPLEGIGAGSRDHGETRLVVYERVLTGREGAETNIEIRRTSMPEGGFVLTLTDMTERARAERMLREAQKMQALGRLTGGIAHDFNNMLTVILSSLDLAPTEIAAAGGEQVTLLTTKMRRASQAAESAVALTRQLLMFARNQPLTPAPVDLGSLLPALVPLLRHSVGENISVTLKARPDLWPAIADAGQLESALLNLALNARDAMQGAGSLLIEAANFTIGAAAPQTAPNLAPGDYVSVSVADTGSGMSPDVIARASEPFFTTKPNGQGTGLGLSTVFGFARQSGGMAAIESEIGRGTAILLYLPRAEAASAAARISPVGQAPLLQHPVPGRAGNAPPEVLVVEDDASVRGITADTLRELNYRVSEASDADEALHLLESCNTSFDLLLTDVMLPGSRDGLALAEHVRAISPLTRVLFMSGHLDSMMMPTGAETAEPVHWLGKPFRRAQLAAKVEALIGAGGWPAPLFRPAIAGRPLSL